MTEAAVNTAVTEEVEHARSAGLRYMDDRSPGLRRERTAEGFSYSDARGHAITDEVEIARIQSLAIPPAYENVWICPFPHGHIQATARDAKGRKQYRYHKRWREVRDANKYESTIAFANVLPRLRERVDADFAKTDMSHDKVLATVVRMLETTLIRVDNETYARDNESYGLTTLRARHVKVDGGRRVRLKFRGKSGVEHSISRLRHGTDLSSDVDGQPHDARRRTLKRLSTLSDTLICRARLASNCGRRRLGKRDDKVLAEGVGDATECLDVRHVISALKT